MAVTIDHSSRTSVGRRHHTLFAWSLALLLHALFIGVLGHWQLAPKPPIQAPTSLDVTLVTQSAVESGAARMVTEAASTILETPASPPEPEKANAPAAPEAPAPTDSVLDPASKPLPEKPPPPEVAPTPEPAREPAPPSKPDPQPTAPKPPPTQSESAPSGRALLAQAGESVRQQGFTASSSSYDSGDTQHQNARRAAQTRYIDAWTRRVETYGNRHYPAPGALDGQLRIRVVIGRDGQLRQAEVIQSSGHSELDQAAMKAVQGAAPYRPFDRGMGERDSLTITRTWRFGKGNSYGVH
nr:TonB family protein [uncultured Halomonas sp.]